ncbi:MAG: GvpL/GvpF family gas vesicle protein [Polyangiaceae bacterium]|nr:GvpL/GvpF family gas vesicle protein [Polyangiaceae bacterium]
MTYVFAVSYATVVIPPGLEGLSGDVRRIVHDGLAAIASDVEDERVRPTRHHLSAHHAVLQALRGAPVLPMRFGHVFPDDECVKDVLLRTEAPRLSAMLKRLEGRSQVIVQLSYDEDALIARALRSADSVPGLAARLESARAGENVQDRIALGELVAEAVDLAQADDERRLLAGLQDHCEDAVVLSHGTHAAPLRAAFLVDDEERSRFEGALSSVVAALSQDVTVECIGPSLPHAFVEWEGASC